MTARNLISKLKGFDVEQAIAESIEETKDKFIELNLGQMAEGKRSDGQDIQPEPYSSGYAKRRQKKGLQTDFIDLRFTGGMYQNAGLIVDNDVIRLGSEVDYEQFVSQRFAKIWGLDDESKKIYEPILMNELREKLKEQLYG